MPFNAFLQLALTGATTATGAAEVVAAFRICYLVATGFALIGAVTSLVRGRHAAHGQVAAPDPAAALPDGARPVASAH
jgi:hypothetical protein